jgi:heparin binding hemagglutinin HbhA
MTDQQTKSTKIPAPLYAAAGVGDLAYQQLRKLPTVVGELSGRAVAGGFELREKAVASLKVAETTASSLRDKATTADLDKLRDKAASNAVAFAQAAQERAVAVYTLLVSHGERVVGTGVVQAADTVNSDIEATEAPKPVTATPADVAEVVESKPRAKRTRPIVK